MKNKLFYTLIILLSLFTLLVGGVYAQVNSAQPTNRELVTEYVAAQSVFARFIRENCNYLARECPDDLIQEAFDLAKEMLKARYSAHDAIFKTTIRFAIENIDLDEETNNQIVKILQAHNEQLKTISEGIFYSPNFDDLGKVRDIANTNLADSLRVVEVTQAQLAIQNAQTISEELANVESIIDQNLILAESAGNDVSVAQNFYQQYKTQKDAVFQELPAISDSYSAAFAGQSNEEIFANIAVARAQLKATNTKFAGSLKNLNSTIRILQELYLENSWEAVL